MFADVPGAGDWATALLLDGNIGIGGDPVVLLTRVDALLTPGGIALVELDPPGVKAGRFHAHVEHAGGVGSRFPWARVGPDQIGELAPCSGFGIAALWDEAGRWFVQLDRIGPGPGPAGCWEGSAVSARSVAASARRLPTPASLHLRWRSPIRGPWLTSVFGAVLLVGIPIEFITGLVSWAAYDPRLAGNDTTPNHGILSFYLFNWVTSPSWMYRVSQGTHVLLGLALVPVLLAKLWSVIPRLFAWPPLRSLANLLERVSLLLLVGGAVFEFVTGILNIDYDYSFKFSFYNGHFYGAWAFIAGFTVHVVLKLGRMWRALRSRSFRAELATGLAATSAEGPIPGLDDVAGDSLVASHPGRPTISRRGALALVGGTSLAVFVATAGQSVPVLRPLSLLSPRSRSHGSGPNAFQVNRTAAAAGIHTSDTGPAWRLALAGASGTSAHLTRADLLSMPL